MRLVSPDRVLFIVDDKTELKALVKRLGLGWTLGGNLLKLCGWANMGGGDEKANWQRLESVIWLKHDRGTELVPLVGKVSHMFDSVVQPRSDMNMKIDSLRKLVPSRTGKTLLDMVAGWRRVAMPPDVMRLADGTSLVGLFASSVPVPIMLAPPITALISDASHVVRAGARTSRQPSPAVCSRAFPCGS